MQHDEIFVLILPLNANIIIKILIFKNIYLLNKKTYPEALSR
jgi:hypothetical protein